MYKGVQKSAEYYSQKFFKNPAIFNHFANASSLMQETISDMTFKTFDIPHRYSYNGKWGESRWKILEDGMFTEKGLRIRNLSLQHFDEIGKGMNYQYLNFFPDHQSHAIRLHSNYQNFLYYQFAETNKNNTQQVQVQFQEADLQINPGYSWSQGSKNEHVFLNGRWANYSGSISHSLYNGEKNVYESFSGFNDDFAFILEGEHTSNVDVYSENIVYYFFDKVLNIIS